MDVIQSFMLADGLVRGRLIAADRAMADILERHQYPAVLTPLIQEGVLLALALADGLKYDGVFALQVKGSGPVQSLFVDVTPKGEVRAYAVFQATELPVRFDTVAEAFGPNARLMFSVGVIGQEPYQGVVALAGQTLTDGVLSYFKLSEQIDTEIILTGRADKARCLMIQKMPDRDDSSSGQAADAFETATVLAQSVRENEMRDLPPAEVLFRLFHAEGLKLFDPKTPVFSCRCRADRMRHFLKSLPTAQKDALVQDGIIKAVCQFCGAVYTIKRDELL